jgi:cysteine-rich repeat protein
VIDCDDGQFCNGPEVCDVLTGICDGTAPDLDDGIACTNDSCDEANDVIVNEPDASTCLADGPCEVATCDPAASGCTISLLSDCCGNGVVEGTEECDDGNEVVDDGCDLVCTVNSIVDVTFTTCGASGSSGPSQSACDGSYAGQPHLVGAVSVTSGIQYWTVPAFGTYRITVNGAKGGNHSSGVGGSGARLEGDFNLSDGTVLKILVGQKGSDGGPWAAGGGGTFVTLNDNSPLIVAAGGGSRGNCNGGPFDSAHGKAATGSGNGGGGSNDGGYCGCGGAGSAGGGFFTDGSPTGSGQAFINGGGGGNGARPGQCIDPGLGGFGGGGNGGNGGGGGGGYEGGHAGGNGPSGNTAGDGGKSYNGGANTSGSDGANTGDGNVHIVRL